MKITIIQKLPESFQFSDTFLFRINFKKKFIQQEPKIKKIQNNED